MDKWIQSFTQSLIQFFKAEMDGETNWSPGLHSIINDRVSAAQLIWSFNSFVKLIMKRIYHFIKWNSPLSVICVMYSFVRGQKTEGTVFCLLFHFIIEPFTGTNVKTMWHTHKHWEAEIIRWLNLKVVVYLTEAFPPSFNSWVYIISEDR